MSELPLLSPRKESVTWMRKEDAPEELPTKRATEKPSMRTSEAPEVRMFKLSAFPSMVQSQEPEQSIIACPIFVQEPRMSQAPEARYFKGAKLRLRALIECG